MGLSIARVLKQRRPHAKILIIDKEKDIALHASGRNSGVLHAGFYYTADSLKARFTVLGSQLMKDYCRQKGLPINPCGKLVVAQNAQELEQLTELERRGKRNGAHVKIITEAEARDIEPNVRTFQKALYSPDTASIDPRQVCQSLKKELEENGVDFSFETAYSRRDKKGGIITDKGEFTAVQIFNCAGLYADHIARDFGFSQRYIIIPFKGLYLKYTKNKEDVRINIYPVPNLQNPFLGVHFTKTVDGTIKIGPTAIPAFWRENYQGIEHFRFSEFKEIAFYEAKLFWHNTFHFRSLAMEEMRKYQKSYLIQLATRMVQHIDAKGFTEFTPPGIRAQLLDKTQLTLVQDFVVEGDQHSCHVLNAVSPAFTCAFAFAPYIVDNYFL
jgi:L-2-hydroxyglutarate oxidase LhgO